MSGYSENSPALHSGVPAGVDLLSKPLRKIDPAKRMRDVSSQKH
jgi:hypothetical protein